MAYYYCESVVLFYPQRKAASQAVVQAEVDAVMPLKAALTIKSRVVQANDPGMAFDEVVKLLDAEIPGVITSVDPEDSDWWTGTGGLHEESRDLLKDGKAWTICVKDCDRANPVLMYAKMRVLSKEIN